MIYWFTGQPGAGKTTLALALQKELRRRGHAVVFLDGDTFRIITLNQDYSKDGRLKNIRAAQLLAAKIHEDGVWVVASFVSPFRALREEFKRHADVLEIYVHTSAQRGREKYFAEGYEPPLENFLDMDTTSAGVDECVQRILAAKIS
jgi:adenylylsulfate kinase-like enzyme